MVLVNTGIAQKFGASFQGSFRARRTALSCALKKIALSLFRHLRTLAALLRKSVSYVFSDLHTLVQERKMPTPFLSSTSALFDKNTRVGGTPLCTNLAFAGLAH
jgi:hypothetical protein